MPLNLRLSNAYFYAGDGLHSGHDREIALLWGLSHSSDGMLMFANEISLHWSWPRIIFCNPVDDGRAARIPATRWTGRKRAFAGIYWPVSTTIIIEKRVQHAMADRRVAGADI